MAQAAAVVLPIAAITYLVYDRVDEFPSRYNAHAPFLSVDDNPEGFEIYWSKKVPGADPKTGFRNEKAYLAELEKIARDYRVIGGGGSVGGAALREEIRELKRRHLMPECVKRVEEALATARDYLKTRNIKPPLLNLPVYVVPTLDKDSGDIHNPWSGRRYMILRADPNAQHGRFRRGARHLRRSGHRPRRPVARGFRRILLGGGLSPRSKTEGVPLPRRARQFSLQDCRIRQEPITRTIRTREVPWRMMPPASDR